MNFQNLLAAGFVGNGDGNFPVKPSRPSQGRVQNIGDIGEKKFIISAQWWRKWCDYANFGEYIMESTVDKNGNNNFDSYQVDMKSFD